MSNEYAVQQAFKLFDATINKKISKLEVELKVAEERRQWCDETPATILKALLELAELAELRVELRESKHKIFN